MNDIFILVLMSFLFGSGYCARNIHKNSIDPAAAIRNTLKIIQARGQGGKPSFLTQGNHITRGPGQPNEPNQSRHLRVVFDKEAQLNRRIHMAAVEKRLLSDITSISQARLQTQMKNIEKSLKRCFDEEFNKDVPDVSPFGDILDYCTGTAYSIVVRFYEEIEFKAYELVKDQIGRSLPERTCAGKNVYDCQYFFKIIKMFTALEYDVIKSIELSMDKMKRHVGADILLTLLEYTNASIEDYRVARDGMTQEKDYLANYFVEKYEEYMTLHPEAVELEDELNKEKAAQDEFMRLKKLNEIPEHTYITPTFADMDKLDQGDYDLASTDIEDEKATDNMADSPSDFITDDLNDGKDW